MNLTEYREKQTGISGLVQRQVLSLFLPVRSKRITPIQTRYLFSEMFDYVSTARTDSADLAREFYDSERSLRTGSDQRFEFYREDYYQPDWLAIEIADLVEPLLAPDTPTGVISELAGTAIDLAEDAGRDTTILAAAEDPEAIGYARVAGGSTSCAFCLTLISRGPVYFDAEAAGRGNAYHRSCDCKQVAVFGDDWSGRAEYEAANEAYKAASKAAKDSDLDVMQVLRLQLEGKPIPKKDK